MYSATAFYVVGGQCQYSFDEVTMSGILGDAEESKGFKLEFESQERCAEGAGEDDMFVFELQALCADVGDPQYGTFSAGQGEAG